MIGRLVKVRKRDGRLLAFDETKIADAIHKAGCAVGNDDRFLAEELAGVATLFLEKTYAGGVPGIEEIQDMVEKVLIETGHARMAKAYILYREKRARSRERLVVEGRFIGRPGDLLGAGMAPAGGLGEELVGPLVGNPGKALVTTWSKARIADALVREADLDEKIASEVAARVEEKVFAASVPRITTSAIRSLVEAELFLMDYGDRVGRQALVGLPRFDVDRLLRGGKGTPWRPAGPADLKRAVADSLLAQYALAQIYSAEVSDAHMDGRLHVLDVGSPFEWVGATLALPPTADSDSWVERTTLQIGRLGSMVSREICVTGVTASASRWEADARASNALLSARRLLGHAALRMLDRRGGRLRTVLDFPLTPDDPQERALADALVREHWALFRAGEVVGLPTLVVHVAAEDGAPDEDEVEAWRRALLPALAAGAETGRLMLVFDRDEMPPQITPWYRVRGLDLTPGVAQPVAGAVAINVEALAVGTGARDEGALLERLDGAIGLALKALRQKRNFLGELQAEPSMPLYRIAAGARPVIAGGGGIDLVHLCGLRAAARALVRDEEEATRLTGRLRSYAGVRLAEEGRAMRLQVQVAPDRDGESSRRFQELRRALTPDAGGSGDSARDLQADVEAYLAGDALPEGVEAEFEPLQECVVLRYPRELSPSPETLLEFAKRLQGDSRVRALRFVPWPDRAIRANPNGPNDNL